MIEIITVKEDVLLINCKNSSIATKMRFEKQVYIDALKGNNIYEIRDIKINLSD